MAELRRNLRGFRPSYFAPSEECDEGIDREKALNLQVYAARVEAGLPLFERASSPPMTGSTAAGGHAGE